MIKKFGAVTLSCVITVLSAGPDCYLAAASSSSSSRSAGKTRLAALPSLKIPVGAEFSNKLGAIGAEPVPFPYGRTGRSVGGQDFTGRSAVQAQVPASLPGISAQFAALNTSAFPQTRAPRFERMVRDLKAPSPLDHVPAGDSGEASKAAGRGDFALRLGEGPEASAPAVESSPEPSPPPLLLAAGRKSHGGRAGKPLPARAPAVEQPRSALFPALLAALAGGAALAFAALHSLIPAAAGWLDPSLAQGPSPVLGALVSAAGFAAAAAGWVAGGLGVFSLWHMGRFARAMFRGRKITDKRFYRFVESRVAAGLLDPGLAERIRPAPRVWDFRYGYAGGLIYVRPELAASLKEFDDTVIHEHDHYLENKIRGPPQPGLSGLGRRFLSELKAWASGLLRKRTLKNIHVPGLERALRKGQLSLRLDQPYDLLLVNPSSEELRDPLLYKNLSADKARVGPPLYSQSPQDYLGDKKNLGRFKAVVMDQAWKILPKTDSPDRLKLDQFIKQLDSLFVMATRGLALKDSGFKAGSANLARYREFALKAERLDRTDPKGLENFEDQIKEFWREIVATRLKGMGATALIENLYKGLKNKGMALLPFGPEAPDVMVWQKLLQYWEAEDGGEFRFDRVDFEDGSHFLVLRKLEARVGLRLKPRKGSSVQVSVPDASNPENSSQTRAALEAAGFKDYLQRFEELGAEFEEILGADVGRQEIYVTIPRRNASVVRQFVAASFEVRHAETHFKPHLTDAPRLHHAPEAWSLGYDGGGDTVGLTDTSLDETQEDFAGGGEVIDKTGEGKNDWDGHGTVVAAIVKSVSRIFSGLARGVRVLMIKVFSRYAPGASEGNIKGGLTIHKQRGLKTSMSLGSRGFADSDLSLFASDLGEEILVLASAGNAGSADESGSSPASGKNVWAVGAAAKSLDDGIPEISFFSAGGPNIDRRYAVRRWYLFPGDVWVGGDVETKPGSPRVYEKGVVAAKSKDMPPRPDDAPDGKHTAMAGTSQAAPAALAGATIVEQALRDVGAVSGFIAENLPLALKAIVWRSDTDLMLPVWRQGAGYGNIEAAVELIRSSPENSLRARLSRRRGLGWLAPKPSGDTLGAWIRRYKSVWELEDKVFAPTLLPEEEDQPQLEGEAAEEEVPREEKDRAASATHLEMMEKFNKQRLEALPFLLERLDQKTEPVWLVRRQAAMALLNMFASRSPLARDLPGAARALFQAAEALAEAALKDPDARVRQMAFLALSEMPAWPKVRSQADIPSVYERIQKAVEDERWDVGVYAAYALSRQGDRGGVARILKELGHADKHARYTSAWLFGQLQDQASVSEAEALSSKVKDKTERGNIRHMAAFMLANIAQAAPGAVSDKVITDLLDSAGPENLALTRSVAKFFPVVLQNKEILRRMREEPLKGAVTAFVLKNRGAVGRPGLLGELVLMLARALDIPLDLPTPVPDPAGMGVSGVDPAMGDLDLIIEAPAPAALGSPGRVSKYWDSSQGGDGAEALSDMGLEPGLLSRLGVKLNAALPLSGSLWVSVPEHKLKALAWELKRRGYSVRLSKPQYSLAGASAPQGSGGVTLKLGDSALPAIAEGADLSLVKIKADRGASEARVMAVLEYVYSRGDPLRAPVLLVLGLGGPGPIKQKGPLGRLIDRLVLNNVGIVSPAGDGGPAANSVLPTVNGSLAVVVAAAGQKTGLQFYSARGSAQSPAITWSDLVEDLDLEAFKPEPGGAYGTAAAAEKSAEKIAALARRLAQVMTQKNGRLPDGYFLYLVDLVKETLAAMPANQVHEAGAGLFSNPEKAAVLLETRLSDPLQTASDAKALIREARRRMMPEEKEAPGEKPGPGAKPGGDKNSARRLAKELRAILGDGTVGPDGHAGPLKFILPNGTSFLARAAGLEGFYYSKKELEKYQGPLIGQLEAYFGHLDNLLAPIEWTQLIRQELEEIRKSKVSDLEKNARLNATLARIIQSFQESLRKLDPSLKARGTASYIVIARAYNRLKAGKNFFDSLDEEELLRIRDSPEILADEVWLLDIFEIGKVRPWGTAGGSPYAIVGYRIKEELGGEEAFLRFVERARRLGLRVKVDFIPNHVAIDSDLARLRPEALVHMVPPQPGPDEDLEAYKARILAPIPREPKGDHLPVFELLKTENYPEGDKRVPKWILAHHPLTDNGNTMFVDMLQLDITRPVAREWLKADLRRLFDELRVDSVRADMAYELLSVRYYDGWPKILAAEKESAQGWAREELERMIAGFKARWEALRGVELWQELIDDIKSEHPAAFILHEAHANGTELSRAGADAVTNKADFDKSAGQYGLYDSLRSRKPALIREALKNIAFRFWQQGGAALENSMGTFDAPEGNPVDKFGKLFKAAALIALGFPPVLYLNGLELGVDRRAMLIGDLSKSEDEGRSEQKAVPFDVQALLNWAAKNLENQAALSLVRTKDREFQDIIAGRAPEVLDPREETPIQAWTLSRKDPETGVQRTILKAANFSEEKAAGLFLMKPPVLADFGAFRPRPDRHYLFFDHASLGADGKPTTRAYSGKQLLEDGLPIELEGGGIHYFEVKEFDPFAVISGSPGTSPAQAAENGSVTLAPEPQAVSEPHNDVAVVQPKAGLRQKIIHWFKAPWGIWVDRLVYLALVPFFFLQWPQIRDNFHHLAHDVQKISILPWIGYSTGILANSNLWGYHMDGKRHAVAFVQATGVITSAIVLSQIFGAGFMPVAAAAAMIVLLAASLAVNTLHWTGRLPEKIFGIDAWKAWNRLSALLGLFALPLGFGVTFGFIHSHPVRVLAASAAFAALGAVAMGLEYKGRLPKWLQAFWKTLGAWLGTLLFVFIPIPGIINNFSHPENITGLNVGTLLLSTWGNLMEVTGAVWKKDRIWFVGSFWAVAVGGGGALLSLFVFRAVSPLLFWVYSIIVPAYLVWAVRQAKRNHPDSSYWETLKFIFLGKKKPLDVSSSAAK